MNTMAGSGLFAPAAKIAFALQATILVFTALLLDGGTIFQVCVYALVGFWGGVTVLRIRAKGELSTLDLLLIRYGYVPACIISFFVTREVWHLRGCGGYL
jgi:hypothetical protein